MLTRTYRRRLSRSRPKTSLRRKYRLNYAKLKRYRKRPRLTKTLSKRLKGVYHHRRPHPVRPRPSVILHVHRRNRLLPTNIMDRPLLHINSRAVKKLRILGMATGIWTTRLNSENGVMRRFINAFYYIPGFELVVKAYYGNRYQKRIARTAIRLAQQLRRRSDFRQKLSFQQVTQFSPDGFPIVTVGISYGNRHYRLMPTMRGSESHLIKRQLARDVVLYRTPNLIRWVFDKRYTTQSKSDLLDQMRSILNDINRAPHSWKSNTDWIMLV